MCTSPTPVVPHLIAAITSFHSDRSSCHTSFHTAGSTLALLNPPCFLIISAAPILFDDFLYCSQPIASNWLVTNCAIIGALPPERLFMITFMVTP